MFCRNCGTQMAEGQKFCPNCGAVIEQAAAPTAPVQPVQPVAPVAPVAPVQPEVQYGAPVPPMQPAPKKSKKGLIITLSIIGAVVIAAGVCVGIFWEDISDLFGGKKKSKSKDKDKDDESTSDFADDEDFDYDYDDDDFEIDMEGYNSEPNDYDVEVDLDDYLNDNDTTYFDEPDTTVSNNTTNNSYAKYVDAEAFLNSAEGRSAQNSLSQSVEGLGCSITLRANGNKLIYDIKYDTQVDPSTSTYLQNDLVAKSSTYEASVDNFQQYITTPGVAMQVRYLNADGTVLADRTFY